MPPHSPPRPQCTPAGLSCPHNRQRIHLLLQPPLRQVLYEFPCHTLLAPIDAPVLRHALGDCLFVDSNKLAFEPLQLGQCHVPRRELEGQPHPSHLDLEDASPPSTPDTL